MSKARLLINRKVIYDDGGILQIRIWYVPSPVIASWHVYKYSLFYGRDGLRLVSYDNERGKGDHKHIRDDELPYTFTDLDRMIDDFMVDVTAMREGKL
jgi:hypothetical protein